MPSKTHQVSCIKHGHENNGTDLVAVEEPLELIVDGHPVSVVMRTPGNDKDLMLGFLYTEGIISSIEDIDRIASDYGENRIIAFLKDHVHLDLDRLTRHVFSASSCGLCGKASLDAVMQSHPALKGKTLELTSEVMLSSLQALENSQQAFQKTGGLHAAGLFSLTGDLLSSHEDIGRHNAVDKVIGQALKSGFDLQSSFLLVSGRVSFEIMQKALAAKIPCLCAVSAPSSLAVEFATESNQTLIGFMRPPRWNLYHTGMVSIR